MFKRSHRRLLVTPLILGFLTLGSSACGGGSKQTSGLGDNASGASVAATPVPAPSSTFSANDNLTQPFVPIAYCPIVKRILWILDTGTAILDDKPANWTLVGEDRLWVDGKTVTFQAETGSERGLLHLQLDGGETCDLIAASPGEGISMGSSGILGLWNLSKVRNDPSCAHQNEWSYLEVTPYGTAGYGAGTPDVTTARPYVHEKGIPPYPSALQLYGKNSSEVLDYAFELPPGTPSANDPTTPLLRLHKRGEPDDSVCVFEKELKSG